MRSVSDSAGIPDDEVAESALALTVANGQQSGQQGNGRLPNRVKKCHNCHKRSTKRPVSDSAAIPDDEEVLDWEMASDTGSGFYQEPTGQWQQGWRSGWQQQRPQTGYRSSGGKGSQGKSTNRWR